MLPFFPDQLSFIYQQQADEKYLPPILTFYSGFLQEILYIYDLLLCARNMIQSVTTTWHHKHFTALCFKKFSAANSSPANNSMYTGTTKDFSVSKTMLMTNSYLLPCDLQLH